MKFVLLALLVVCAIAARAHHEPTVVYESFEELSDFFDSTIEARNVILQPILDVINGIKNQAKKGMKIILQKAEDILNSIRDKTESITTGIVIKLKSIARGIEDKFGKLAEKNKAVKQCFETYNPSIKSAIKDFEENNGNCVRGTLEQTKGIGNDVHEHVEAIQDHMDAMQDLIADCLESNGKIIGAAKCLWKQVRDFKTNIFQMIGNGKDLLVDATKRAINIAGDGTKCIIDAGHTADKQIKHAIKNLEECIMSPAQLEAMHE